LKPNYSKQKQNRKLNARYIPVGESDMLDATKNCFVSIYITDFNSLEMMSVSDVNAQMNKSANADVGDFP